MKLNLFTTTAITSLLSVLAMAAPLASPELGPTVIPTVKVQLNWDFNQKSQIDVSLNNSAFTTRGHFFNDVFNSGFLESASIEIFLIVIQCQGYSDEVGTIKVGNAFRGDDIALLRIEGENKPVRSLKCGFVFT